MTTPRPAEEQRQRCVQQHTVTKFRTGGTLTYTVIATCGGDTYPDVGVTGGIALPAPAGMVDLWRFGHQQHRCPPPAPRLGNRP